MAQPPAAVVLAYEPVGLLRLFRLDEQAQFYCVHCCKDKTDTLVATTRDNWAKTICKACYDSLVHRQEASLAGIARAKQQPVQAKLQPAQKAKPTEPKEKPPRLAATKKLTKTAQAKQQPVHAQQQPPRKVHPQQPMGNPPPRMSKAERRRQKEREQLERRLPGIDRLPAFFGDAGIQAKLVDGGCLWINGGQTRPLAWILPTRDRLDWNSVIDEMAVKYVGDKFRKAVADNARFGEGLRAFLRQEDRGIAIMRGDVRLAIIHATSAQIPHCDVIYGNFLKPGPHWKQVADAIHSVEDELVTEWKQRHATRAAAKTAATEAQRSRTAARRRLDRLPNSLAPELIAACLDASRRIRLERQVAYERPVVLQYDLGELTLLPVTGSVTRLLMPFRLTRGTETLNGELILGDYDPLPLLIGEGFADEDAIMAWTCALLGFADATCIEFEPVEPTARREPARLGWRQTSPPFQQRSPARTMPRKRWPKYLEPVGHWIQYSGAFVAGHRRRLNDGQTASVDARDRARQVGITLDSHETWVRPHTRGVPEGIEMRFRWHAPPQLKLKHT
jgi:hypothetical protein